MPAPLIGLGVGLVGAFGKMFGRGKANRELRRLEKQNPAYQENPIARQRLGYAQTLLNARTPGAAQVERNIYTSGANAMAGTQRAATDASQLLAAGSDIQGNTNDAFANLGVMEAQDYQRRYGNLENAQEGVIREGDKVFNDKVRRFNDSMAIRGAQQQNRQNTWGDISNLGFSLADFGMSGGFRSMFGGGSGNASGVSPDMLIANPTPSTPLGNVNMGNSPAGAFGNITYNPLIRR